MNNLPENQPINEELSPLRMVQERFRAAAGYLPAFKRGLVDIADDGESPPRTAPRGGPSPP